MTLLNIYKALIILWMGMYVFPACKRFIFILTIFMNSWFGFYHLLAWCWITRISVHWCFVNTLLLQYIVSYANHVIFHLFQKVLTPTDAQMLTDVANKLFSCVRMCCCNFPLHGLIIKRFHECSLFRINKDSKMMTHWFSEAWFNPFVSASWL